MMKIVIDKDIPFIRGVLEPFGEVDYLDGAEIAPNDLRDAQALLVRTRTSCNAALLEGTGVRFIGSATIGQDHIDASYCDERGIRWSTAPGCNAGSVQQYIAAALLRCAERHSFSLRDKTIGVIGVGNVGARTVSLCRVLGMRVLCNDPPRVHREGISGFISLDTLLDEADIISMHVPLTKKGEDATFHLLDRERMASLRNDQIIINTSRGEVVDETSLKTFLRSGRPERAVIDVWRNEPAIDHELLALAGIATPHIAGYSVDGKATGTAMIVRDLSRHFGLGMDDWYPPHLPEPPVNIIEIDSRSQPREELLAKAIKLTYDIVLDDRRLRADPGMFEIHRSSYPVRREYPWYAVKLSNGDQELAMLLQSLGFTVSMQ
jgi:erythronate-4-phosphate dehydrogenase